MNPKGNPQNLRKGRPKGIPNKATREIKAIAAELLSDPAYVASLRRRLPAGKAPHMETLLHHYAYGKPKESLAVSGEGGGPVVVKFVDV